VLDLEPATRRVADLVSRVSDAQLTAPTPCERYSLADLLDHVSGLAGAFAAAARKDAGPEGGAGPSGDAGRLGADWRTRIPTELAALARAWRDPQAWEGPTRVGPFEMTGADAGIVALNEVVVHGWDIARATGQPYDLDPATASACVRHLSAFAGAEPVEGLFGRAVPVPADAPQLDRIVALSGRDPAWTPGGATVST
jgi:uncharacterized protein (TIGR03086 family)